jgi:hypothetical protein
MSRKTNFFLRMKTHLGWTVDGGESWIRNNILLRDYLRGIV